MRAGARRTVQRLCGATPYGILAFLAASAVAPIAVALFGADRSGGERVPVWRLDGDSEPTVVTPVGPAVLHPGGVNSSASRSISSPSRNPPPGSRS